MNTLLITDRMDHLTLAKEVIQKYVNPSLDKVYYFCSSVEEEYELSKGLEDKFIKNRDCLEGYEGRYDTFLKQTEALYHKLCGSFSQVYSKVLRGFDTHDMSQYDICILLMDFLRVYDFLKYIAALHKIERIIILGPNRYKADYRNGVYGYLEAFPIDSSMAILLANELGIERVDLKIKVAKLGMPSFIISLKKSLKYMLRHICYICLKIKDIFALKQDRRFSNMVCFGSLGHLLSTIKEINRTQKVNLYFYHPIPLVKTSAILHQNNARQVSGQYDNFVIRLKFIFNKIRAAGIAKNFKIKLKGEDGRNIDSFFESLFNDYFKHSIPDFAHKFDIYTNLLNKIKPKAALLDESVSSLRKPFELAAKIRNVPVFVINHGIPAKGYPIFLNKNITDYSYLLIGGEYIKEVYGGYYKANMGKLIVTGTPRYDDIYSLKKSEDSAANTICFAPTFFLKRGTTYNFTDYIVNFKQNLHVIVEKYKEKPFRLIVKFHPGDPHENIVRSAFAASEVKATYVADRLRSIDVLKDSELLITCWSSMALEGCLCNLPVIIMNNFAGIPEPIDFVKDRIAIFARTPEALGRLIDDYRAGILNNPSYASNAKSASFKYEKFQDGKASKRVAEFILKEIGYK